MVVIHLKGDGERLQKEQVLYECPGDTKVGELTTHLTELQNIRVRLRFMIEAAKALQKEVAADERLKAVFDGPIEEASRLLSADQVEVYKRKIPLSEYQKMVETLKGCAIIAFPQECTTGRGGLSPVESLCKQLEDDSCENMEHVRGVLALIDDGAKSEDMLPVTGTQAWWAGKLLHKDDLLNKYTGKNEKTKIVVKLTKTGGHAPTKEPAIDAKTQQDMMAYYYKKQEETKKLVDDDDISYGNAAWANPKGLKNHFQGTGDISWKPKLP